MRTLEDGGAGALLAATDDQEVGAAGEDGAQGQ